ncbi:hypothetical protein RKD19_007561 [Streptomyces canus]|nr:acetyltransferase [Streptomyces sp. RP5T]RRR86248.1 acetyltransferase [Streptomyces sp. RP5T]
MGLHGEPVLNLFHRFAPSPGAAHVPDLPLIARVRPANRASQRVAERAGLSRAPHLDTEGYDGFDWIYVARPEHWAA